jgi:hypothetical protein
MPTDLFDPAARLSARRRARAYRGERFLLDRAFADLADRLALINRPLEQLLLVGGLDPAWAAALAVNGARVDTFEPSDPASSVAGDFDDAALPLAAFDAIVVIGALDSVNQLPRLLGQLGAALKPDSPLIGAFVGGQSLFALQRALVEADRASRRIAQRVHPRIDPASFAQLLAAARLVEPVIDVDRVTARYRSLAALAADLRAMGGGNILAGRDRAYPGKAWLSRAAAAFAALGENGATSERFDLIHFTAWSPPRA